MALQVETLFKGVVIPDAYVSIHGDCVVSKDAVSFVVTYRAHRGAAILRSVHMETGYGVVEGNPFALAYAHLKTLPEFAEALDV